MLRYLKAAAILSGALFLGSVLGVTSHVPLVTASQAKEPAPDPNKKKAGDACKSSDECQSHHSCVKVGDKNICQAPERHLPPGAVT